MEVLVLHIVKKMKKGVLVCLIYVPTDENIAGVIRNGLTFSRRGQSLSSIVNHLYFWFSPGDQARKFQ